MTAAQCAMNSLRGSFAQRLRRISRAILLGVTGAILMGGAQADPWPAKPVKIVVPTSPGGATDTLSRALAERLGRIWNQPVVVENRPGANQIIGGEYVARAPGDGYTLIVSDASTFVINPFLYKHLSYDPQSAFAPVSLLVRTPWIIAVNAAVPARSLGELLGWAREHPGSLSYGSFGNGSSAHICMDYLKTLAGVDIVHVPFKGSAPALNALVAGEISLMMVTPLVVEPHVRTGRLRLIAAASAQRLPLLPDLPTVAESGFPGYEAYTWFGMLAPAATPEDLRNRISADVRKVMADPAFREQFIVSQWLIPADNTPDEFAAFLKSDAAHWRHLIEASRVSVD
jgi:tripartite-type tricarboxylate transporter receptor subunit TctC